MYEHAYTCYGSVRPFGISTIVAGVDKTGPGLYVVEPSGSYYGYRASAVGKGRQLAKTELEKLDLTNLTVRQGVMEVARMWVLLSVPELPLLLIILYTARTSCTMTTKTATSSSR